jgi:hypothetical protein
MVCTIRLTRSSNSSVGLCFYPPCARTRGEMFACFGKRRIRSPKFYQPGMPPEQNKNPVPEY